MDKIPDQYVRYLRLIDIAPYIPTVAAQKKDFKLIDQAVAAAERIDAASTRREALRTVATSLATAGEKEKIPRLINRAIAVSGKTGVRNGPENEEISTALASVGDIRQARRMVEGLPFNARARARAGILQGWAEGHPAPARRTLD